MKNSIMWLRVTKKLEVEKFDKAEINLSELTKYWIKVIFNGRSHTTTSNNTWELFEYEVYDPYLDPCELEEMNLSRNWIRDEFKYHPYAEFMMYDSEGTYRVMSFTDYDPAPELRWELFTKVS